MNNRIEFEVYGKKALFTDPLTKPTGEKASYPVPTYSAMVGICERIFWKPAISYRLLKVRVMNEIIRDRTPVIYPDLMSGSANPARIMGEEQYLVNPRYQVLAEFFPNPTYSEKRGFDGYNTAKYQRQIQSYLARGGKMPVYLGTTDCEAFVESCKFGEGEGFYDQTDKIDFGRMFLGFTYPDVNESDYIKSVMGSLTMRRGIIDMPDIVKAKEEDTLLVRKAEPKEFINNRKEGEE